MPELSDMNSVPGGMGLPKFSRLLFRQDPEVAFSKGARPL
jgi:hypothetical protein